MSEKQNTCRKCRRPIEGTPFCPHCGAKQGVAHTRRGNGTGSAYKRGAYWQAQIVTGYTDTGRPLYTRKSGFRTKKEALAAIPEMIAAGPKKPKARTLAYYYESWMKCEGQSKSASKMGAYRIAWNRIAAIHDTPVSDLSVIMLRDLVAEVTTTYYPARDIKNLLSHCFKLAIADGSMQSNLSTYIVLPPQNESERTPWSDDELRIIWESYDKGDYMAPHVLLMTYTGMMPGELFACRKDMIDIEGHQIVGAGLKTDVRKQTPITLPDIIVPVLETILGFTPADYPKLVRRNKWDFYDAYHAFTKAVGVRDLPMYSCRHTTATALAVGVGAAPSVIQKVMRHASFRMTQHYIHPDTSDAYDALNRLGRAE